MGYDSIEAVLSDARVDAVYIATPNHLHAPYALLAAQAGKQVLAEKPIALTMSEGIEVVRAARDNGITLGVGFELRQHPGRIEARNLIAAGTLGTVALAQSQFGTGVPGAAHPEPGSGYSQWWTEADRAGGAFYAVFTAVKKCGPNTSTGMTLTGSRTPPEESLALIPRAI